MPAPSSTSKSCTAHCQRCGYERRFRKRQMNHGLHLVLTLLSGGVWGIAWISATIKHSRKPWRCTFCGSQRPARQGLHTTPATPDMAATLREWENSHSAHSA